MLTTADNLVTPPAFLLLAERLNSIVRVPRKAAILPTPQRRRPYTGRVKLRDSSVRPCSSIHGGQLKKIFCEGEYCAVHALYFRPGRFDDVILVRRARAAAVP